MKAVSWLHLSDWHQNRPTFDRALMSRKLVEDIEQRASINGGLSDIDFVLFSGDLANTGATQEFEDARKALLDPIRDALGKKVKFHFVPGNHDIDRNQINAISTDLRKQMAELKTAKAWHEFNSEILKTDVVAELNRPLGNYFEFIKSMRCAGDPAKLYSVKRIERHGINIGLVCINTAWNCARFRIEHVEDRPASPAEPWLWDYGMLRITEAQLQEAIDELGDGVDLGILMMHHPLHWIDEFERARLEQMLFANFHIVVHGHEHRPNTNQISSAFGELVFMPAGATYTGRLNEDTRYTNAYNFTVLDTEKFTGTVFHRIWFEDRRRWQADERFWLNGQSPFALAKTKKYDSRVVQKAIASSNKRHIQDIPTRPALVQEITVRHDQEIVDGEPFIRARIKIRIKLRKWDPEKFTWITGIDSIIGGHSNPKVRERAYRLIRLVPSMAEVKNSDPNLHSWSGVVGEKEQWLEYEYEKLDLPNNFHFAKISRFTDRVRLTVKPANGYQYEYLPIGGFPALHQQGRNDLDLDTLGSEQMISPNQGYIAQWRPAPNPAPKITTVKATAKSKRRKAKTKR